MNGEPARLDKTMSAEDFRLVPAAIDFNTFKTQMVVAALAGVVALAGVALPTISTHPWGFVFAALATIFFGQVVSQISALWGNRLGAVPAMWGAIWFAVYPRLTRDVATVYPSGMPASVMCCSAIAAVFFFIRWFALRERRYLGYAAAAAALCTWSITSSNLNWLLILPGALIQLCVVFPCMFVGGKKFGQVNAVVGGAIMTALIIQAVRGL